jgi:hypothetical protein
MRQGIAAWKRKFSEAVEITDEEVFVKYLLPGISGG